MAGARNTVQFRTAPVILSGFPATPPIWQVAQVRQVAPLATVQRQAAHAARRVSLESGKDEFLASA